MRVCATCGGEVAGDFAFCPFCGAALLARQPPRELRKVVTVLFCDIIGSTELGERLDPEALRLLLARYFERMKAIVERHGGSVEKFIGDAVMAVFGVPTVHEDDALRAIRAAVEMRDALPELGVDGRIGVTTGEVVTGTAERLATGDAVNVAARLQQAAQPGAILIGEQTLELTRDAADVEAVAPLDVKGKAEPLLAYHLLAVHGDEGVARRVDTPLVGRATELRRLRAAYEQAGADASCQLFTILGSAGVGKSRLAAEFLTSLDDARIVRGRCLPYGEGITYWPVVEIVEQLPDVELDGAAAQGIRALLGDDVVISREEIAWSFRKLLEAAAAAEPLVCVFDDIHWGEETFLALVESVADVSRGAPILLLCIARPELLDRRPGWAGGKLNSTSVLLEPLGADDTNAMIASLGGVDDSVRARIGEAAEGNPLFVEQMVALAKTTGAVSLAVPPTIQALLAARLEQLDEADRSVLERGAVEGRIFHRGAVEALAPEDGHAVTRLTSLVRKELIRPDKPQFPGEDAFRFRHLLIRDAAYDALPKARRADLHERFAEWLQTYGSDRVEPAELLGYHLEQAFRYRIELGAADAAVVDVGRRAAQWLAAAGRRAFDHGDMSAAAGLLRRASALLPADDPARVQLLPVLGSALVERGEWDAARSVLADADRLGREQGMLAVVAEAKVAHAYIVLHADVEATQGDVERELDEAARLFEQAGDEGGLARALTFAGRLPFWRGEAALGLERLALAASHARAAGDRAQELDALASMLIVMVHGATPIATALQHADALERLTTGSSRADFTILAHRAELELALGHHDRAQELVQAAAQVAAELDLTVLRHVALARARGGLLLHRGDPVTAQHVLQEACDFLLGIGDMGHLVSILPYLADALFELGRIETIAAPLDLAADAVIPEDMDGQVGVRRARAKLHAARGELDAAERVIREALALIEPTEFLSLHCEVLSDAAEIAVMAGRGADAVTALESALALHERRGATGFAEETRARLATVGENR